MVTINSEPPADAIWRSISYCKSKKYLGATLSGFAKLIRQQHCKFIKPRIFSASVYPPATFVSTVCEFQMASGCNELSITVVDMLSKFLDRRTDFHRRRLISPNAPRKFRILGRKFRNSGSALEANLGYMVLSLFFLLFKNSIYSISIQYIL